MDRNLMPQSGYSPKTDPAYVLIVDDDDDHRQEMAEYLSARGIAIVSASNASTAFEFLKQYAPRLVIMDVNMPGADGVEAVRVMRGMRYENPIILMSGDVNAVYQANTSRLAIFAVLSKPIPMPALERHIRSIFQKYV